LLQQHKEQATGLSKAAQGLNDTLYVSGNSDEKMARAQSAAQVRIQYMARRFSETGFTRLVNGVYKTLRTKLKGKTVKYYDQNNLFKSVDPSTLPDNMLMYIDADVGENSNSNIIKKMQMVGEKLIPALQQAGAGGAVNPAAAVTIACKTLEAMDLDPLDYMVDYTAEDFKQKAEQSRQAEAEAQEKKQKLEEQKLMLDITQKQATLDLTNIQAKNAMQDNAKQLMVSLDKSQQEWAKLYIAAAKEGVELPPHKSVEELLGIARAVISSDISDASAPRGSTPPPNQPGPAMAPEQLM
jgi:paraquat-inducible protein B